MPDSRQTNPRSFGTLARAMPKSQGRCADPVVSRYSAKGPITLGTSPLDYEFKDAEVHVSRARATLPVGGWRRVESVSCGAPPAPSCVLAKDSPNAGRPMSALR